MARLIEVHGPGCRRCTKVLALVREVVRLGDTDVDVRAVTDPAEIARRGLLMRTPALVIDGRLVAAGRVPSRQEITNWLDDTDSRRTAR